MSADPARLEEIFGAALSRRDFASREAYVDEACGSDAELRARVSALLAAHDAAGDFLKLPDLDANDATSALLREAPGTVIGNYKLLEQIGEGGFAVVFMAQQAEPVRRRVALKIIKLGMDTRQIVTRFEAERQALAMMDHPSIAKVFDAGATDSGRPYFVMELVAGVPITAYCDEHNFTIDERLALIQQVCNAVQHAHQKGVIHRDIKPSNVLVSTQDDRPTAKVIDFGIAKATQAPLTDNTLFTDFRQLIGTPAYMSPEQAEGSLDIDTRSDVYSLGVLLYELLTGSPPFDPKELRLKPFAEMQRFIREVEPPTPSSRLSTLAVDAQTTVAIGRRSNPKRVRQLIRGELDWIVMRALEKDRARRYQTTSALADDIERFLTDQPVSARPATRTYRLKKFAYRNRKVLISAALGVLMLAFAGGGLGWAVRDRARRDAHFAREKAARQAALEQGVNAAIRDAAVWFERANWPEATAAVKHAEGLLEAATDSRALSARVENWRNDLDTVTRLEDIRLANSDEWELKMTGEDEYQRLFRSLGVNIDTLESEEAARRIRRHSLQAYLVPALDDWTLVRRKLMSKRNSSRPDKPDDWWQRPLVIARLADSRPFGQRLREAIEGSDFEMLASLADSTEARQLPGPTLHLLAHELYWEAGGLHRDLSMRALKLAQMEHPNDFSITYAVASYLSQTNPNRILARAPSPDISMHLADEIAYWTAAVALRPQSAWVHHGQALALFEAGRLDEAIAASQAAIRLDPGLAAAHTQLGISLAKQGKPEEAIAAHQRALEIQPELAVAYSNLGVVLDELGRLDEAIAAYRKAIEIQPDFAQAHGNLGNTLRTQGKLDEALDSLRRSVDLEPTSAVLYCNLAKALLEQESLDEALDACQKAIDLEPEYFEAFGDLGNALQKSGRVDEAVTAYRRAIELYPDSAIILNNFGSLKLQLGELDEAAELFRRAIDIDRDYATPYVNLGNVLQQQSHFDDAVVAYCKALELAPDDALTHCNLGMARYAQNKYDEAIAESRKAIELQPDFFEAHSNLGNSLAALGKLDEAMDAFRTAFELKSDDAARFTLAAWELVTAPGSEKRHGAFAADLAAQAVKMNPTSGDAWGTLGAAQYRAGQWQEAIDALNKALELREGGDAHEWYFMAMAHGQLGHKEGTRLWYDKSEDWTKNNLPESDELRRLRSEATEILENVK